MKSVVIGRRKAFFRGILRTSQGSTILVAVENRPISPSDGPRIAPRADFGDSVGSQELGAGVKHSQPKHLPAQATVQIAIL
jgi:hypothetical protein